MTAKIQTNEQFYIIDRNFILTRQKSSKILYKIDKIKT